MASLEKLIKALEAINAFDTENLSQDNPKKKEMPLTKKEKISNAKSIADCMCAPGLRGISEFPKFLGVAVETFVTLCDDPEPDVRIMADECLNRTIKTLLETNLGRIQVELYKEIKKNSSARSLRAALSRFADLCHLIRPQKCRPYVVNLLPCLTRVCQRPEEAVQETLVSSMHKICPVLTSFANDTEIKALMKSFLANLSSSSAAARRTAASSLALMCQHSRKPQSFNVYLLTTLLDLVVPVDNDRDQYLILGVLLALRHLIPQIAALDNADPLGKQMHSSSIKDEPMIETRQLIQLYQMLLYHLEHADHNVITSTLETLQQLLKTMPRPLLDVLLTDSKALEKSLIYTVDLQDDELQGQRTHSRQPSIDINDENLEEDADLSTAGSLPLIGSDDKHHLTEMETPEIGLESSDPPNETTDFVSIDTPATEEGKGAEVGASGMQGSFTTDSEYTNVEVGDVIEDRGMSQSSSMDTISESRSNLQPMTNMRKFASQDTISASSNQDFPEISESVENLSIDVASFGKNREGDIGTLLSGEKPLVYFCRLLCSRFLLTGFKDGLMGDKQIRVSVKTLALGCTTSIIRLCPDVFLMKLHNSSPVSGDLQDIQDVLQYASHNDPQLKGTTALLVVNLLQSSLRISRGNFEQWLSSCNYTGPLTVKSLVSLLISLLEDDSSVVCRQALIATKLCLQGLLNSCHSDLGLKVIMALLHLKENPYWLVKVELLEVLGRIDFKAVEYLENICDEVRTGQHHFLGRWCIQEYMLKEVFLKLLADENNRVRHASATALVKIIPRLFCSVDHPQNDAVVARAKDFIIDYLDPIMHEWSDQPVLPGLVEPYHLSVTTPTCPIMEGALSRVIAAVVDALLTSTAKHLTNGCCHALCLLSDEYSVPQYGAAWCCAPDSVGAVNAVNNRPTRSKSTASTDSTSGTSTAGVMTSISVEDLPKGSGGGPLGILVSLLMASPVSFDLSTHNDVLRLAGNLFAGAAYRCLRPPDVATISGADQVKWGGLSDRLLVPFAEQLMAHVSRVLNICAHIIDDINPGPPSSKATLPSLPNAPSLSPIKRKARGIKDDPGGATPQSPQEKGAATATGKESAKETEKEKSKSKDGLGTFHNIPHYMRLHDVLKGAFSNYMVSLDMSHSDKFLGLLKTTLKVLAQLLEVAGFSEVGKHIDELLGYFKSTVTMEDTLSVLCVQQLLKALFGTNLASQWECSQSVASNRRGPGKATRLSSNVHPGLYHNCFTTPYTQFTQCLASATYRSTTHAEHDDSHSMVQWLKKRAERKIPAIMKPGSKIDKTAVAAYIRLFEPLVIKAFKQYTITSSLQLQQQVLKLLAQLVQLRVNYCLLDSDQIFLGFVIKQFEIIEEGQIRQSDTLIPHIFNFLVLLSYERYHSKSVIGMPKIIQLCDGLLASGLDPKAHVIPALRCIVHDLFVLRVVNKADAGKDADTQREFVVSMLLRIIRYWQVLELLILVLYQCRKDGEDKWKRLSRQVTDTVLPLMAKQQIDIDSQEAMDVVHRLFESVAPSVFRPVDLLLASLFALPPDLDTVTGLQRWLSQEMILLRVLLNQSKEEMVLSRLYEMGLSVSLLKDSAKRHRSGVPCEAGQEGTVKFSTPEETMARLLLQILGVAITEISWRTSDVTCDPSSHKFVCQLLSHFMLYVTHMFQSGVYRKVATFAMSMIKQSPPENFFSIEEIETAFKDVASLEPTLTLQWCNILILLNYDHQSWWSDVLQTPAKYHVGSPSEKRSPVSASAPLMDALQPSRYALNVEVVRRGCLILFCDYVCENLNDAEHVTWVVINHVNDLIMLSHEPPVQDLISAIHRNSAASGLFIQAIHSRCDQIPKPSLVRKTLQCLESIHLSQSGALLTLLIDKFLRTHHLAVSQRCDSIACRRLDMLLADSTEESMNQLPLEDLEKLLQFMKSSGLTKRHRHLASLLNKQRMLLCPESQQTLSPEKTHPLALTTISASEITIDKKWYVSIVRDQCFAPVPDPRQCALLLQALDYTSILNIIMAKECKLEILEDCITLGTSRTLTALQSIDNTTPVKSPGPYSKDGTAKDCTPDPLLQASQLTLFRHLNNVINSLPVPHQPLSPNASADGTEDHYHDHIEELLNDHHWLQTVLQLSKALHRFLVSLPMLPWRAALPNESTHDIARFSILGLEVLYWQLTHHQPVPSEQQVLALECFQAMLEQPQLHTIIDQKERMTWVCSAIKAIHQLLTSLIVLPGHRLVYLPHQDSQDLENRPGFDVMHHAIQACDQISELVGCLHTHLSDERHAMLSRSLTPALRSVIISVARLSLVNSYARTPPLVWKLGWLPSPTGDLRTCLPSLPLDYLQEKDVLREFIHRVNTLGWTSRQQFEETWMSLLAVLNPIHLAEHQASVEEDIDRCQSAVMATRCITSLLLQSALRPDAGNPNTSVLLYKPRNHALTFLQTKLGQKLIQVRGVVEEELRSLIRTKKSSVVDCEEGRSHQMLVDNLERMPLSADFSFGQTSIESIWSTLGLLDETSADRDEDNSDSQTDGNLSAGSLSPGDAPYPPPAKLANSQRLSQGDLDIHSCLHFLLELFKQLLDPNVAPKTPLMQLNETVKAVVALSDLFTEKAQYEWLLDTLLQVHRTSSHADDELVTQYVIVGVCKAASVVSMELAIQERVLKLVEASLRSTHLPTKISALQGALYILQTGITEVTVPLINTLTEYLHRMLSSITHTTIHSLSHVLVMWALVFYILENCTEETKDTEFASKMLQLSISVVSSADDVLPLPVYMCIVRGLERLLLADVMSKTDAGLVLKLSVDRLCLSSPQKALGALGLLLTCLYSGRQGDQWNPTEVILQPEFSLAEKVSQDPESLISALERVTVLFDRIRKGLPYEARVIARILPKFLADFFLPQDVMNKVIAEFLSTQQPHPQLMATIVFGVFGQLLESQQEAMVQDWVMLSLSNFTQRSPIAMATWSLTCFFLSASSNTWLRALLPHLLRRMGKMDVIDTKLFCIAATDFWNRLQDPSQKTTFLSTFQSVSKPDTPYEELLTSLS